MQDENRNNSSLNVGAILLGWLLDFAGQFVLLCATVILYGMFLGSRNATSDEVTTQGLRFTTSITYRLVALVYEAVFTVAGAYMAAALAKRRPVFNAVGMGFLALLTGSALYHFTNAGQSNYPLWYVVLSLGIVVPLAWFGGYLQMKHALKRKTPSVPTVSNKPPIPDVPQ